MHRWVTWHSWGNRPVSPGQTGSRQSGHHMNSQFHILVSHSCECLNHTWSFPGKTFNQDKILKMYIECQGWVIEFQCSKIRSMNFQLIYLNKVSHTVLNAISDFLFFSLLTRYNYISLDVLVFSTIFSCCAHILSGCLPSQ